jgi:hypothetical protein
MRRTAKDGGDQGGHRAVDAARLDHGQRGRDDTVLRLCSRDLLVHRQARPLPRQVVGAPGEVDLEEVGVEGR